MIDALATALSRHNTLSLAVSGGVDSMTLAHMAQLVLGERARMVHATSPAVPQLATARVREHAARHGWRLDLVDAGEFDDPRYRANPVNRCLYCKTNLYGTIVALAAGSVASGTNTDDLGDFRPGLKAAEHWRVVHPYVEAGMAKGDVYALAARLGLADLAALPAQPCLASRIETGIAIDPADLGFIDRIETMLRSETGQGATVRCRITHAGVIVESDAAPGPGVAAAIAAAGRVYLGHRSYRRGAAFLHGEEA